MKRTERTVKKCAKAAESSRRSGELLRAAALPEVQSPKYPCITMLADRHIEIENHCGVLEIGSDAVRLKTSLGVLRIEGDALKIRCAESLSMLIDGKISSVCYENTP